MKLFKHILEKKLESSDEYSINSKDMASMYNKISAIQLSSAILENKFSNNDSGFLNKVWKKMLSGFLDIRSKNKLKLLLNKYDASINNSFDLCSKFSDSVDSGVALWSPGVVAVLEMEYPEVNVNAQ